MQLEQPAELESPEPLKKPQASEPPKTNKTPLIIAMLVMFVAIGGYYGYYQQQAQQTQRIKQVQQLLNQLTYQVSVTGNLDARTQKAIETFEQRQKLLVTEQVDQILINNLQNAVDSAMAALPGPI